MSNPSFSQTAPLLPIGTVVLALQNCTVMAKLIQQLAADGAHAERDVSHELKCIELLAAQLGFQADRIAVLAGFESSFGDADDWLLPSAFKEAVDPESNPARPS